MENALTELMDVFVPELGSLITDLRYWLVFLMVVGPVALMLLGAYYLFMAPPEANHKAGYRTFYGMGSVSAWKFTQKLAGRTWIISGLVMLLVAIVGFILMIKAEVGRAVTIGLVVLIVEAIIALVAYIAIEVTVSSRYDENGNLKKK